MTNETILEINTIYDETSSMEKLKRKFVGLQRQIKRTKGQIKTAKKKDDLAVLKAKKLAYEVTLEYIKGVYSKKLRMELAIVKVA